jgi:hypothetical protein
MFKNGLIFCVNLYGTGHAHPRSHLNPLPIETAQLQCTTAPLACVRALWTSAAPECDETKDGMDALMRNGSSEGAWFKMLGWLSVVT